MARFSDMDLPAGAYQDTYMGFFDASWVVKGLERWVDGCTFEERGFRERIRFGNGVRRASRREGLWIVEGVQSISTAVSKQGRKEQMTKGKQKNPLPLHARTSSSPQA